MEPISSLSREYVYVFVEGATGAEGVEIAFTTPNVEPTEAQWRPALWHSTGPRGAEARILIGPDTDSPLTDGTYQAWARITGPVERPVLPGGLVPIT
ncbi:hypothetical protein Ppa06_58120 [Planomonospora parontospora subsp. parontospora]|uniref:Uncharacterized protein n=2 Tax=Planomonospora parontospora TaxID=58119 RepID=A0AA37F762_9ACTN|nr:hypothetical protein [Planomonospora parontospora]GGK90336.1 hypothetical protein GCM10010126_57190 [Planomonospora parontospora]GII12014.1 hypothetical protein Ppa06_58120 [Planomonospora parontospora subsp. parontospora]